MISILYVDDDPLLLDIGKRFLERSGDISVMTINSGQQAIEIIDQKSFDAIISDYEMPGMDGIELLRRIRLRQHWLPFVLFTGKSREEVVIRAINYGADSYLQKGGDVKAVFVELENMIKNHVDRLKTKKALEQSELRYRLLVDNAQQGIYIIQNERIVFSNTHFLLLTKTVGINPLDIDTRSVFDLIHPDDKDEIRSRYLQRITKNNEDCPSQFRVIDKNGSVLYFQVNAIKTEWNGKPATLNFLRDITKEHNLESNLIESEKRYHDLLDLFQKR